jgi:shikimate kinase
MEPEPPPPAPRRTNLVLVGFMGCGKSSVGRLAAGMLGYDFVDTDQLVVERAGLAIPDIFKFQGETAFRQLESEALASLRGRDGLVVATGGGIVTRPENVPLLQELGVVVWIDANEEALFERVSRNNARPLLQTENPRATLRALLEARRPLYAAVAQGTIDNSGLRRPEAAHRAAAFVRAAAP